MTTAGKDQPGQGPLKDMNVLKEPVKTVGRFIAKPSGQKSDTDNMIKMFIDSLGAALRLPPPIGRKKAERTGRTTGSRRSMSRRPRTTTLPPAS